MTQDVKPTNGMSIEMFTNKVELLEVKISQIDRKLSNKADEVVSIQLYQHRRELEELYETVERIESHLKFIDGELSVLMDGIPDKKSTVKKSFHSKVRPLFT